MGKRHKPEEIIGKLPVFDWRWHLPSIPVCRDHSSTIRVGKGHPDQINFA